MAAREPPPLPSPPLPLSQLVATVASSAEREKGKGRQAGRQAGRPPLHRRPSSSSIHQLGRSSRRKERAFSPPSSLLLRCSERASERATQRRSSARSLTRLVGAGRPPVVGAVGGWITGRPKERLAFPLNPSRLLPQYVPSKRFKTCWKTQCN